MECSKRKILQTPVNDAFDIVWYCVFFVRKGKIDILLSFLLFFRPLLFCKEEQVNYLTAEKYSFLSNALEDDAFAVVNFKGFEGISKPYEFNIMLVSEVSDFDMSEVLKYPVRLTFHREEGDDVHFNGILAEFEQLHEYKGYVFYRALLVPKLWQLKLTQHNRVILNKSVPTFIENTLKDGGLITNDFDFRLQSTYQDIDYVCQYGESHFNFISRWLEREGIYYYFEQTVNGEKVIFTDTKISHTDLPFDANLIYAPPSGLDTFHRTEVIKSFTCRQRQLPQKVKLKEYNYERPSLEITGEADVDVNGRGTAYVYGEHFPSSEEGNRLAGIRAEELLCHKSEFFGESTVPYLIPGFTFNLENHFNTNFNRKFLIGELAHEGNQTGYLISGIRAGLSDMEAKVEYLNNFKAIPVDVQHRPDRTTTKPLISGILHAKIDAEGSGDYAEVDDQGRYKVRLPFDTDNSHGDGKASSFIRMMQPYSGNNYGVHFPLHKGAEVLLSFVNGDPDRPVISGTVPNPENVSPVTSGNQTESVFRDSYGNELVFDSTPGDEHIRLRSPHHESVLQLGKSLEAKTFNDHLEYKGGNTMEFGIGNKLECFAGNGIEVKTGIDVAAFLGIAFEVELAGKFGFLMGPEFGLHLGDKFEYQLGESHEKSGSDVTSVAALDNVVSAGQTANLVGGSGKSSSSIVQANKTRLSLSVGSNRAPDAPGASTPAEVTAARIRMGARITLYIASVIAIVVAIVAAITSFVLLFVQEKDGLKPDASNPFKTTFNAVAGGIQGIESFAILVSVVTFTIAQWLIKGVATKPVSHMDSLTDKPVALIDIHKDDGIFLGIEPVVEIAGSPKTATGSAVHAQLKKDEAETKINMKKTGEIEISALGYIDISSKDEIVINTEDTDITMNVGDDIKYTMSNTETYAIDLTVGDSGIGVAKDGDIYIETSAAGEIRLNSGKDVWMKSKTGDLVFKARSVYAKNGIFETKNIKDLG